MQNRWKQRPQGSNWGDFGPNDQLGRLNLITKAKILQGVAEVKEGRSFCLSLPLDIAGVVALNPRRPAPRLQPLARNGRHAMNYPLRLENSFNSDFVCDDCVQLSTQYSTQWDSLAHVGHHFDVDGDGGDEAVYYNGFQGGIDVVEAPESDDTSSKYGARRLGVENMAVHCVQGRGVMIDLEAHYGRAKRAIGFADLQAVIDKDKVVIEEGDIVCLHTGLAQILLDMDDKPDADLLRASGAGLDGRDPDIQRWVTESGIAAIAADNLAVEIYPAAIGSGQTYAALPLHEHCLFRLGVNLGELWYLTELATWLREHKRSRFLLTAPPLRLPGAVGSPLTPVATV